MNTDNLDIIPGTDKFLRLHINDLSRPMRCSNHHRSHARSEQTISSIIVTGAVAGGIAGGIAGVLMAYLLGLLP